MTPVRPLLVGPANCVAALGVSWRWLRDHAPALGLTIIGVDGKRFLDAEEAKAAIARAGRAELPSPSLEAEPTDELAVLRAQLGKRRIA